MRQGLQKLGHEDFLSMREGARVLEADMHGEKVLRLADGSMLKLFRRKRLISSAAWYPYARRFIDNAAALRQLGIPVPEIIAGLRIPSIERDAVHYTPLAGVTLRYLISRGLDPAEEKRLKEQLTAFIIRLHGLGIYFRSLHLGNVILTPEGELGLIDFSDLRIYSRALPRFMRWRNIRRMLGIPSEREWIDRQAILGARFSGKPGNAPGSGTAGTSCPPPEPLPHREGALCRRAKNDAGWRRRYYNNALRRYV